jgi:hypothetical protein
MAVPQPFSSHEIVRVNFEVLGAYVDSHELAIVLWAPTLCREPFEYLLAARRDGFTLGLS